LEHICPICRKVFLNNQGLRVHYIRLHGFTPLNREPLRYSNWVVEQIKMKKKEDLERFRGIAQQVHRQEAPSIPSKPQKINCNKKDEC